MELAVGDAVVYAAYGVGRVVAHEDREVSGVRRPMVILALANGLTVSLPLDLAETQLRSLASEADLRLVEQTLRQTAIANETPWLARRRDMYEKLSSGGALGLAEIIRDTSPLRRPATGSRPERSAGGGEQDVLRKARLLLASEIAAVRGVDITEADDWIGLQLSSA
jgi:RNA polymerase-interacting CarD/CdnL/TRCF family regulator